MAIQKSERAVLITGCSSGIGQATAVRLAREGWAVYATARKVKDLEAAQAAGCRALALDVTDEASMTQAVNAVEAAHGAVSVLVNNAGYSQTGAIEAVPLERVRQQFETNVFGLVRLTQRVLPGMRRQGFGYIVNLSSMGGKLVFPGFGYYHATKFAVEAISDALRFEVQRFGIRVIVIEPGLIKTGFSDAAAATADVDTQDGTYGAFHRALVQSTRDSYTKGPLALLAGTPEDVADTIAKAVTARRPRTRYTVSPSARLFLAQRRLMSDRLWDWGMRLWMPAPGAQGTAPRQSGNATTAAGKRAHGG